MFYLHVVHEQGMVGSGRDNPDVDSILWIPVQELIIDKDLQIMNFISLRQSSSTSILASMIEYYINSVSSQLYFPFS